MHVTHPYLVIFLDESSMPVMRVGEKCFLIVEIISVYLCIICINNNFKCNIFTEELGHIFLMRLKTSFFEIRMVRD